MVALLKYDTGGPLLQLGHDGTAREGRLEKVSGR
jgi:hypothetical protein